MKLIRCAFVIVGALAVVAYSLGQHAKLDTKSSDLLSGDVDQRWSAAAKETQARKEKIASLLHIAKQREKKRDLHASRELAIGLLGEYRALEAVDYLVDNITFEVPGVASDDLLRAYPCAKALIKIGLPAPEKILKRLAKPCEGLEIELFAYVIHLIDGHELAVFRLQRFAKQAETISTVDGRTARANLEKLRAKYRAIAGP